MRAGTFSERKEAAAANTDVCVASRTTTIDVVYATRHRMRAQLPLPFAFPLPLGAALIYSNGVFRFFSSVSLRSSPIVPSFTNFLFHPSPFRRH